MRIDNSAQPIDNNEQQDIKLEQSQLSAKSVSLPPSLDEVQPNILNMPIAMPTGVNRGATRKQAENSLETMLKIDGLHTRSSTSTPTSSRAVDLSSIVKSTTSAKSTVRLKEDPANAVNFINKFNAKLNLTPTDLKEKLTRMAADAHTLFRAMPALFFQDIKNGFANKAKLLNRSAPEILIDADAHLENFGTFRGPDGHAVWGINDFDQAEKGSPESDLERLATSTMLVARNMGLDSNAQKDLVKQLTDNYLATMKGIASGKISGDAYLSADEASGPVKSLIERSDDTKRKDFLEKYTSFDAKGSYHFLSNDKLKPVSADRAQAIKSALNTYQKELGDTPNVKRPLQVLDVVEKLGSGGSSYGLPRYYALVANSKADKAPIILEIKGLLGTPISDQSGDLSRANGKQVVENWQSLSGYANPLSGATKLDGRSVLVRELEPEKNNIETNKLTKAEDLEKLVKQAATVLAKSHGRTEDIATSIMNWVSNDEKKLTKQLGEFARAYAEQMEADRKHLSAQIA